MTVPGFQRSALGSFVRNSLGSRDRVLGEAFSFMWTDQNNEKIYHQSAFTSTVKASRDVQPYMDAVDVSAKLHDITNGDNNDSIYLITDVAPSTAGGAWAIKQSGRFTTTVRATHFFNNDRMEGISTQGSDTLVTNHDSTLARRKLFKFSGQFTSTVKSSVQAFTEWTASDQRGISWDGANTLFVAQAPAGQKLFKVSGVFSSTLKTSLVIESFDHARPDSSAVGEGISWDGDAGSTLYIIDSNTDGYAYALSGQFTTTVRSSIQLNGIGNGNFGIEALPYSLRTTPP